MYEGFIGALHFCLRRWINAVEMDPNDQSYWVAPPKTTIEDRDNFIHEKSEVLEAFFCLSFERKEGKPAGPKFVKKWESGKDPRFNVPANPLYDPSAPRDSDWRDGVDVRKFLAFLKFCKQLGAVSQDDGKVATCSDSKCPCSKLERDFSSKKKSAAGVKTKPGKSASHSDKRVGLCQDEPMVEGMLTEDCKSHCASHSSCDSIKTSYEIFKRLSDIKIEQSTSYKMSVRDKKSTSVGGSRVKCEKSASASKMAAGRSHDDPEPSVKRNHCDSEPGRNEVYSCHETSAVIPEQVTDGELEHSESCGIAEHVNCCSGAEDNGNSVSDSEAEATGSTGKGKRSKNKSKKKAQSEHDDTTTVQSDTAERQEGRISSEGDDSKIEDKKQNTEEEEDTIISRKQDNSNVVDETLGAASKCEVLRICGNCLKAEIRPHEFKKCKK
jgi:hypothetical protein